MDNEKDMILKEFIELNTHDSDGFVELTLSEGMATEYTDKMRERVDAAKELATQLDDRLSAKFKNEFNKQLMRFNTAVQKKEDLRNIDTQLKRAGSILNKYKKQV